MTDQEIAAVARRVLAAKFAGLGFLDADASSEADFDGSPIVRVRARFERRPQEPSASAAALHDIRSALLDGGEERFIVLANEYADQDQDADEDVG